MKRKNSILYRTDESIHKSLFESAEIMCVVCWLLATGISCSNIIEESPHNTTHMTLKEKCTEWFVVVTYFIDSLAVSYWLQLLSSPPPCAAASVCS